MDDQTTKILRDAKEEYPHYSSDLAEMLRSVQLNQTRLAQSINQNRYLMTQISKKAKIDLPEPLSKVMEERVQILIGVSDRPKHGEGLWRKRWLSESTEQTSEESESFMTEGEASTKSKESSTRT